MKVNYCNIEEMRNKSLSFIIDKYYKFFFLALQSEIMIERSHDIMIIVEYDIHISRKIFQILITTKADSPIVKWSTIRKIPLGSPLLHPDGRSSAQ